MTETSKAETPLQTNAGAHVHCIVFGCLNSRKKDPALSFFKLPPQLERREKWLKLVGREDLLKKEKINHRSYTVCMLHFESSMMNVQVKRMLRDNALPTKFLLSDVEIQKKLLGKTDGANGDPEMVETANKESSVRTAMGNSNDTTNNDYDYETIETFKRRKIVESYVVPTYSVYVEESQSVNVKNEYINESPMSILDEDDNQNANYKHKVNQNYFDTHNGIVIEFIDEITLESLAVSNLTLTHSIHTQTEPQVSITKSTQTAENVEETFKTYNVKTEKNHIELKDAEEEDTKRNNTSVAYNIP